MPRMQSKKDRDHSGCGKHIRKFSSPDRDDFEIQLMSDLSKLSRNGKRIWPNFVFPSICTIPTPCEPLTGRKAIEGEAVFQELLRAM